MKFCTLCRFYTAGTFPRCGHADSVRGPDPVTGMPRQNWTCEAQRTDEKACGQSGKWFVHIEEKVPA